MFRTWNPMNVDAFDIRRNGYPGTEKTDALADNRCLKVGAVGGAGFVS